MKKDTPHFDVVTLGSFVTVPGEREPSTAEAEKLEGL